MPAASRPLLTGACCLPSHRPPPIRSRRPSPAASIRSHHPPFLPLSFGWRGWRGAAAGEEGSRAARREGRCDRGRRAGDDAKGGLRGRRRRATRREGHRGRARRVPRRSLPRPYGGSPCSSIRPPWIPIRRRRLQFGRQRGGRAPPLEAERVQAEERRAAEHGESRTSALCCSPTSLRAEDGLKGAWSMRSWGCQRGLAYRNVGFQKAGLEAGKPKSSAFWKVWKAKAQTNRAL
ncbi:unnamed protein product [Urochloa humidicola]